MNKRLSRRYLAGIFFLLIGVVTIGGCRNKETQPQKAGDLSPAYGDAIVVGSIGDAITLVPILASDSASQTICGLVFNGMVKYNKDIELVGDLAESWEILQDGLVIVFHLRKGVKWHDGEPFTARDVKFTYEKLIDPRVKTPYSGDFRRVKSLEVIDDWTVKITYKQPFSPGLASWGMWIMPEHLLKSEDLNNTEFARRPVGTGPYKFKSWETAEKIELTVNPDYFEGRPYINRYIYRIIPDSATMFLELYSFGVDYIGLTPLQYRRQTVSKFFDQNYRKFRYPSFGYTYLGYNLEDPRFRDIRVRKAIDYAIDKDEIIKGVLLGLGRVCTGPFPPESWAYNSEVKPRPYNPEKAEELLGQAGWVDTNGDGWRDKNGKKFEFTIITNQGNEQRKMVAEIIQHRLARIGIRVRIKIIEWSSFISEFIDKRKFEAIILGWGLSRDPDLYDIFHSSKTKEGEFNFVGYKNPEVDKLLEEGRRIFDREERKKIYQRIHRILYDDVAYSFLYVPDALPVINQRFEGIKPAPLGIGYNFIKWYVPEHKQRYIR